MSDDISIPSPTYRVPRHRRGMDPAAKRRIVVAAGLFGAILVVGGGWAMLGHRSHTIPVVEADPSPVRVKPANPGGLQVAAAGNEIFSGGNDTTVDKLAPPPETPNLQALRAPPPPPVARPAEVPPVASAPPPAPAKPAAVAAAPLPTPPLLVAAPKPAAATPAAPPAHADKGLMVQIAALRSEQAAKAEWEHLAKRMPDLLGGRRPAFSKLERDGRTYWRVRTGGFSDVTQATLFCTRLRAKGGSCSVAEF